MKHAQLTDIPTQQYGHDTLSLSLTECHRAIVCDSYPNRIHTNVLFAFFSRFYRHTVPLDTVNMHTSHISPLTSVYLVNLFHQV